MLRSHKIALVPNNKQVTYFAKASGVARFAYNWALAKWEEQYKSGLKPSEAALRRELNAIKREQYPWMLEVTKCAPQMAIKQLGVAYKRYFQKIAGRPTFKKRGINDSFTLSNDQFKVKGKLIRVPNLGWVKMTEELRYEGKIISATISRVANRWFVAITVDIAETPQKSENQAKQVVGIDLGITTLATLSTGEKRDTPKALKENLGLLKHESKSLSRKQKGSKNRAKARQQVAKLHARIANIRKDGLHKLTTELTKKYNVVVIEDLNVKGMIKNPKLSRAIADMGFHEFRRQLTYKAEQYGVEIVVADRFYPSSKLCSECEHKLEEMSLGLRHWTCPQCGIKHDRDINAAKNLEKIAVMAVSSTVTACGGESSGLFDNRIVEKGETSLCEAGIQHQ